MGPARGKGKQYVGDAAHQVLQTLPFTLCRIPPLQRIGVAFIELADLRGVEPLLVCLDDRSEQQIGGKLLDGETDRLGARSKPAIGYRDAGSSRGSGTQRPRRERRSRNQS